MSLSDVDRAEILLRYRMGQSARQLADRFGVSPDTVERAIPAGERRPSGFTPAPVAITDAELVALRDTQGLTYGELATRLGMTRGGALRRYRAACRRMNRSASA